MLKGRVNALIPLWEIHRNCDLKFRGIFNNDRTLGHIAGSAALRLDLEFDFGLGTVAEGAPIIPISAQLKYNIEVVCEYIVKKIPVPLRDFTSEPRLIGM